MTIYEKRCKNKLFKNIKGETIGNWLIIDFDEVKSKQNPPSSFWIVKCLKCGSVHHGYQTAYIYKTAMNNQESCSKCLKEVEDLSGKTYGNLYVEKLLPREQWRTNGSKKNGEKSYIPTYLCKCSCSPNKTTIVTGKDLKNGNTTSCGCYLDSLYDNAMNDWIGKTINYLTILSYDRTKKSFWCKCKCGTELYVSKDSLYNREDRNQKISCGCTTDSQKVIETITFLQQNDINFQREITFDDLLANDNKTCLRFDFGIYDKNNLLSYLIEVNGQQHYEYVPFFHNNEISNFEKQKQYDMKKQQYCEKNNIPLIVIRYDDSVEKIFKDIKGE